MCIVGVVRMGFVGLLFIPGVSQIYMYCPRLMLSCMSTTMPVHEESNRADVGRVGIAGAGSFQSLRIRSTPVNRIDERADGRSDCDFAGADGGVCASCVLSRDDGRAIPAVCADYRICDRTIYLQRPHTHPHALRFAANSRCISRKTTTMTARRAFSSAVPQTGNGGYKSPFQEIFDTINEGKTFLGSKP